MDKSSFILLCNYKILRSDVPLGSWYMEICLLFSECLLVINLLVLSISRLILGKYIFPKNCLYHLRFKFIDIKYSRSYLKILKILTPSVVIFLSVLALLICISFPIVVCLLTFTLIPLFVFYFINFYFILIFIVSFVFGFILRLSFYSKSWRVNYFIFNLFKNQYFYINKCLFPLVATSKFWHVVVCVIVLVSCNVYCIFSYLIKYYT